MPLYKKQVVEKVPLLQPVHPDTEVFVIPFTGEVFLTYESYISRLLLYKRRIWSCEASGKEGLTYQEALESETMALNMTMSAFPETKRRWALSLIHYNSCTVADIIDMLIQKFSVPLQGEIVTSGGASYRVVSSQDDVSITAVKADEYVGGMQGDAQIVILPLNKIKRDRQLTSKIALKRFIKDVAYKEGGNIGGTWMVKPELVTRYNLDNKPFQEVLDWLDQKKILEMQDPSKKYGKGFPVEDSELFGVVDIVKRPMPCFDFGNIEEYQVADFMTVWNFLSIFSKKLKISSFTFEEFKTCLSFQSDDFLPDIIAESFAALLVIACGEWSSKLSSSTGLSSAPQAQRNLSHSSSLDNLNSAPTESSIDVIEQKGADLIAFESLYETFSVEEKAAIDQWYKWAPEKWMAKDKRKTQITVKDRYKAWQIALAGLIKDWMTEEDFPGKYSFLVSLLHENPDYDKISEAKSEEKESAEMYERDSDEGHVEDDVENNSNISDEEDSESDESNIVQYALRKKRRVIKDEDAETEEVQAEFLRKSRRKSTPSKLKSAPAQTNKTFSSSKDSPAKNSSLEFARLCRNAERGFSRTTCGDRIKILYFLVHFCVEPSVDIHSYIDQCIEQIAELKRNQRALIKDRKIIKEQREGFNKRDKVKLKELGVSNGVAEPNEVTEGATNVEKREGSIVDGSEKLDDDILEDAERPDDVISSEKLDDSVLDASDRHDDEGEEVDQESDVLKSQQPDQTLRQHRMSIDQQKRDQEEARRMDLWEKLKKESKQVQKEFKAHEDERKKIEDKERNFAKKESSIDLQLRAASGPLRVRLIGQDRYFNRYWWFDGSIGGQNSTESNFFAPKGKYRSNIRWASGYLFVEDFGLDSSLNSDDSSLDMIKIGNVSGKWGFYSEVKDVIELTNWLDARGVRERNLINNLSKIEDLLIDGMEQRIRDTTS